MLAFGCAAHRALLEIPETRWKASACVCVVVCGREVRLEPSEARAPLCGLSSTSANALEAPARLLATEHC